MVEFHTKFLEIIKKYDAAVLAFRTEMDKKIVEQREKEAQKLWKEIELPKQEVKEEEIQELKKKPADMEKSLAKTGTDSTVSVSYISSRMRSKKKEEDLDEKKGKGIKRLSRIKQDNFL